MKNKKNGLEYRIDKNGNKTIIMDIFSLEKELEEERKEEEIRIINNRTETHTIDGTKLIIYDNLYSDKINEVRGRLVKYLNDDIKEGKIKESYRVIYNYTNDILYRINIRDIKLSRLLDIKEIIIAEGEDLFFEDLK